MVIQPLSEAEQEKVLQVIKRAEKVVSNEHERVGYTYNNYNILLLLLLIMLRRKRIIIETLSVRHYCLQETGGSGAQHPTKRHWRSWTEPVRPVWRSRLSPFMGQLGSRYL